MPEVSSFEMQQLIALAQQQVNLLRMMQQTNSSINAPVNMFGRASAQAPQQTINFNTAPSPNPFHSGIIGTTGVAAAGAITGAAAYMAQVQGDFSRRASMRSMINKSKISPEMRAVLSADLGDKVSSGLVSLGGTAASFGMDALLGSMHAGFITSQLAAAPVAIVSAIAADQVKQQNAYNKYLVQNSGRFIGYNESTNPYQMGGWGLNDRMQAATYLRHANVEKKISTRDVGALLSTFTEGDLLRQVDDIESFQEQFSKMVDVTKKGALALNTSLKNFAQMMAELKQAGFNEKNADMMSAQAQTLASFTKSDASAVFSNLTNTAASLVSGTSISIDNQYQNMLGKYLYTSEMYDAYQEAAKSGDSASRRALSLINNFGGREGASQQAATFEKNLLQNSELDQYGILFYNYNDKNGTWQFDRDKFNQYINSNMSANQMATEVSRKYAQMNTYAKNAWYQNGSTYLQSDLDDYQMSQLINKSLRAYASTQYGLSGSDYTTAGILGLMGYNGADAQLYGNLLDYTIADQGKVYSNFQNAAKYQDQILTANANATGWKYAISSGWNRFKNFIGDTAEPVSWLGNNLGEKWSHVWSGYKYSKLDFNNNATLEDVSSLTSMQNSVEKYLEEISKNTKKFVDNNKEWGDILGGIATSVDNIKNREGIGGGQKTLLNSNTQSEIQLTNTADMYSKTFGRSDLDPRQGKWQAKGKDFLKESKEFEENMRSTMRTVLGLDAGDSETKVRIEANNRVDKILSSFENKDEWNAKSTPDKVSDLQFLASYMYGGYESDLNNEQQTEVGKIFNTFTMDLSKVKAGVFTEDDENNNSSIHANKTTDLEDVTRNQQSGSSEGAVGENSGLKIKDWKKQANKAQKQLEKEKKALSKLLQENAPESEIEAKRKEIEEAENVLNQQWYGIDTTKVAAKNTDVALSTVASELGLEAKDYVIGAGNIDAGEFSYEDVQNNTDKIKNMAYTKTMAALSSKKGGDIQISDLKTGAYAEFFSNDYFTDEDLQKLISAYQGNQYDIVRDIITQGVDKHFSGTTGETKDDSKSKTLQDNVENLSDSMYKLNEVASQLASNGAKIKIVN